MDLNSYRLLYVEDNILDVRFVHRQLEKAPEFNVAAVDTLNGAMTYIDENSVDIILLDLNLPDAPGSLETFVTMRQRVIDIPIVVLTSITDESLGRNAVKKGAQDYLIKGNINGPVLINSIRHAMERSRDEQFLRAILFSSNHPIVVVNWKGLVKFINPPAEKIFGKTAEEWVDYTFGYTIDLDRPVSIDISGVGSFEMNVAETEVNGELYHVIHLNQSDQPRVEN